MPHERNRHGIEILKKYASFSPSVGVVGLRQVGKTTLLSQQLGIKNLYSLDDLSLREEATSSPRTFLSKLSLPCVIDEIQKAPNLFDALKLKIDTKRVPGRYYVTGSTEFSAKVGVRESLTGRMAMLQLFPMTLAEAHQLPLSGARLKMPNHSLSPRLGAEAAGDALLKGGLPVPLFLRDPEARRLYLDQWIETALVRDLPKVFGRSYDLDLARNVLERMGQVMRDGEVPSLGHFKMESRKLRRYLFALEGIFLVRRVPCHEEGTGLDRWMLGDGGLAASIMSASHGEGVTLSLARHLVLNEILAGRQYVGHPLHPRYYKSAQAKEGVDLVWDGIPIKILHAPPSRIPLGWYEKPVIGAMKKLGAKVGLLVAPVDQADLPKKGGIGIVPWTHWS